MRKKFTMLFAALLACAGVTKAQVTSLADFDQNKCYTVTTSSRGGWAVNTDGTKFCSTNDAGFGTTVDKTNVQMQFAVLSTNATDYYLYSVSAKKFIKADCTLVAGPANALAFTDASSQGAGRVRVNFRDVANSYINLGGSNQMTVDSWGTIDGGNAVIIEEAADFDPSEALAMLSNVANITYKYYVGDTYVDESKVEAVIGEAYPAADGVPGYVTTTGVPEGTVEADGTYDIQCSLSSDFPFSTTEYFGLTTRAGAKWLIGTDDGQALTTTGLTIANVAEADTYSWIVEGTWYDGFYFKNKQTSKYLAIPSENPGDDTGTVLTETKDDLAKFAIDLKNGKYYIRIFDTENNCLSDYGGNDNTSLKTWNSTSNYGDAGSQFAVVSTDAQSLLDAFKNDNASCVGYVGGYDVTADEINELTLETVGDFVANNEKIALSAGYYFIKGTGTGNNTSWYATYGSNNSDFVATTLADGEKLAAKHVWSLDAIDGEDGYKLKSCNLGKYAQLTAAPSTSQIASDYTNGYKFTFTDNGAGKHIVKDGNNNVMRTEGGGQVNYWSGEASETWYLIPVTELEMTINEFASICLPFDVQPEGATAYAIESTNGTNAILAEKADIPAGEGAILEGNGTVKLNLTTATSNWDANLLDGTFVDTYVEGAAYVLAKKNDVIGLYKTALNKDADGAEGATHFKNNANKAYLVVDGANAPMFSLGRGEGTTSIDNAQLTNDNEVVIYDLAGRRVQKMEKGIYIVNGKKVIK